MDKDYTGAKQEAACEEDLTVAKQEAAQYKVDANGSAKAWSCSGSVDSDCTPPCNH